MFYKELKRDQFVTFKMWNNASEHYEDSGYVKQLYDNSVLVQNSDGFKNRFIDVPYEDLMYVNINGENMDLVDSNYEMDER